MKANPTTEVHLRQRSTPYDFEVVLASNGGSLTLYDGASYKSALAAYWQAVNTLHLVGLSGSVRMDLSEDRQPYGGFSTEIEHGRAASLHVPHGGCISWAYKQWSTQNIAEKMIATAPGMLRPVRHPRPNQSRG